MSFEVKILGSNSSLPAYGRHHTSQYLKINDTHFLVDCGEGTQYRIQDTGVSPSKINDILISHLHGDHCLGVMGMIYSFHLTGRSKPLRIYGQRGLDEIITTNLRYAGSKLNYRIEFHELDPESSRVIYENRTLEVRSFPLQHRVPCCGFIFREKEKPYRINSDKVPEKFPVEYYYLLRQGKDITDKKGNVIHYCRDLTFPPKRSRSYAFCSDTAYDPGLAEYLRDLDMMYHETTFLKEMESWARRTYHSTTHDAADIAHKSGVKKLLIGHFSARYREVHPFVDECREIFPETYPAEEGQTYTIEE